MKYLTLAQILFIYDLAVKRYGGSFGLRDQTLLESAIGRPQSSFDGIDMYKTIFDKAAALLQSFLKNHPFVDGNKRTALSSAILFLWVNGYHITNVHDEEVEFAVSVDNQYLSLEEISDWLKKHSKKKK